MSYICRNTKTLGQGMEVRCGELEWGPGSETYLCLDCLRRFLDRSIIALDDAIKSEDVVKASELLAEIKRVVRGDRLN